MKKISRVMIIMLLMLSAATALVFMGLNGGGNSNGEVSSYAEPAPKKKGLSLSDEEFALEVGEVYQCGVFFDGAPVSDDVHWTSSDPQIAAIDGGGSVTAMSAGEAEISVRYSENAVASAKVWVYDQPTEATANAVKALAADGGDQSFITMATLARQLGCAKNASVKDCADLLGGLVKFSEMGAGGSGAPSDTWKSMFAALTRTGRQDVSTETLRGAALAAYCQGEKLANDVTISFTGDCTFAYFNETDRANMFPSIYRNSGSVTYPFDLTKNVFAADDITMINLEGTFTRSREHKDKTFYFRGEPSYVDILTNASVEAVTVENNHSFDYWDKGYNETLSILRGAKVRYTSYHSPAVMNVNGYRVVMLSLSMVSSYYKPEFKSTIEQSIRQYRADKTIIIVNLHWGIESADTPEAWQIEAAHSMIDAGADMIIGHHPHVLQGIEQYKGHYIVYSLGNFSFGGNSASLRPATIIFRASFNEDGAGHVTSRVSVVPCYTTSSGSTVNNFRPTPRFGSEGGEVVDKLLSLSAQINGGITEMRWNLVP